MKTCLGRRKGEFGRFLVKIKNDNIFNAFMYYTNFI